MVIEQWRQEYNQHRLHSSLGYLPPAVFAERFRLSPPLIWSTEADQFYHSASGNVLTPA
jgi:hypothetical protein